MSVDRDILTEKLVNFMGERLWYGFSPRYKVIDTELHFYVINNKDDMHRLWYHNYFYLDEDDTVYDIINELESDYNNNNCMIIK